MRHLIRSKSRSRKKQQFQRRNQKSLRHPFLLLSRQRKNPSPSLPTLLPRFLLLRLLLPLALQRLNRPRTARPQTLPLPLHLPLPLPLPQPYLRSQRNQQQQQPNQNDRQLPPQMPKRAKQFPGQHPLPRVEPDPQGVLDLNKRARLVLRSKDRLSGNPDRFRIQVDMGGFTVPDTPIDMKLDYVSPVYINTSQQGGAYAQIYDSIVIVADTAPQYQSYSSVENGKAKEIGLLIKDGTYVESSAVTPQAWNMQFDHAPMTITPDLFQAKVWNLRLRFANDPQKLSTVSGGNNVTAVSDWTMVLTLTLP